MHFAYIFATLYMCSWQIYKYIFKNKLTNTFLERKSLKFKPVTDSLELIVKYARHGVAENEIPELLGISKSLFRDFLKKNPDTSLMLKNARILADIAVEEALFKRATGYLTTEEHEVFVPDGDAKGTMKLKEHKFVKKFVPPDASNALIWLFNRKSASWSKNPAAMSELSNIDITALKKLAAEEAAENM
jgi:hypothetical protein